jgi:hypothetical protein
MADFKPSEKSFKILNMKWLWDVNIFFRHNPPTFSPIAMGAVRAAVRHRKSNLRATNPYEQRIPFRTSAVYTTKVIPY